MKEYDVIVIGSGVGLSIVFKALSENLRVALVDKGHPGGTCLNVGCVPSKMLVYPADVIAEMERARKLGVHVEVGEMDFGAIMGRMRNSVRTGRSHLEGMLKEEENLDYYHDRAHFVEDYTLEVGGGKISGRKLFIASGARPFIPQIEGLEGVEYLTNETVLGLEKRPASIVIVGGGYIAVEYGHFFSAMGTKVTIMQRNERLLPNEEPEMAGLLKKELGKRMEILTDTEALEVRRNGDGVTVKAKNRKSGEMKEIVAEKIMIAAGRKSNADLLKVENTGVEADGAAFISVDDYLQTKKKNIWALGDSIGRQMFTHAGDKEAEIAWHNATHEERIAMDFDTVPHAVFTYPQMASVGLTEERARKRHDVLVGRAKYSDIVKGEAMMEEEGFAKAIVEKNTERILGFHIIGPEASILIQEVVNTVAKKAGAKSITESMHIFPALSELIPEALNNLE